MAMALLRELAGQALPLTVRDPFVVEHLRWLRAANFIAAVASPPASDRPFGTVFCLTKRGREALKIEQEEKAA